MDDTARAMTGKAHRHTNPHGYPPHIDPEATPPPAEPPPLAELAALAPHAALAALRDTVAENTAAISRVWEQRHSAEQVERMLDKIDGLMKGTTRVVALVDEFILPETKKLQGLVQELSNQHQRTASFWASEWPAALRRLDDLVSRLGHLETGGAALRVDIQADARATSTRIAAIETTRLTTLETAERSLDTRLGVLERDKADKAAGDKRQRLLLAVAGGAISFVAGIAGYAFAIYTHLLGK